MCQIANNHRGYERYIRLSNKIERKQKVLDELKSKYFGIKSNKIETVTKQITENLFYYEFGKNIKPNQRILFLPITNERCGFLYVRTERRAKVIGADLIVPKSRGMYQRTRPHTTKKMALKTKGGGKGNLGSP